LTILAKKNLSHLKISEAKSQRREKNTLGEPLNSAHFSLHEKSNCLLWMPLEKFVDIKRNSQLYNGKIINASKTETSVKHT
jgi:hypothetical protein